MLRIVVSTDAAAVKSYYAKNIGREDYYLEGQQIVGQWRGRAAERLGLHGTVTKESFHALCDNRHPLTGNKLNPRTGSRVAYDVNFHASKSVSLVHALTGDPLILDSFRASVHETMRDLETEMQTRTHVDGKTIDRVTGNFVYAEFVDLTARPVDGIADAHLHLHNVIFNCTWFDDKKRFQAGQFHDLKRNAPFYQSLFHARFAKRLADAGYPIVRTKDAFEIATIPASMIDKFSRRTKLIEAVAKAKGITDPRAKAQLGAKTREKKQHDISYQELLAYWTRQLSASEKAALLRVKAPMRGHQISAGEAVNYALARGFERESVVSSKRLMAHALHYGVGSVTLDDIVAELGQRDMIAKEFDGQQVCTTREVLSEEKQMLAFVREGKGTCKPFHPNARAFDSGLNPEQNAAIRHVLGSQDRVIGLRGGAGTGKTTLMKKAVPAIEQSGKKVFIYAPTAEAARDVLKKDGFEHAETIAALLQHSNMHEQLRDQVLWIDEAGLLSVKDMQHIFTLAQRYNARVILGGDSRQHTAVTRGDALRILERFGGLSFAELHTVVRQKANETYKRAIEAISSGDIEEGFKVLEGMVFSDGSRAIIECDGEERYHQLARDYVRGVQQNKTVLVVSPTHREGDHVTELIRAELRKQKKLGTKERLFVQQGNLSLTEAERALPESYTAKHIVQFHQNVRGFVAGERVRVVKSERQQVQVQKADGTISTLPLASARHFQVYDAREIALATGERIRITQNGFTQDRKHRLHNGGLYQVKGFTGDGHIALTNGWIIDKHFGNLAYGYTTTSHSSQGKSVDVVLLAQNAESFSAASREQFYVSASRGKEVIKIYTDNKAELKEAIVKSGARLAAVELEQGAPLPAKLVRTHAQLVSRLLQQRRPERVIDERAHQQEQEMEYGHEL